MFHVGKYYLSLEPIGRQMVFLIMEINKLIIVSTYSQFYLLIVDKQ